MQQVVTVLQLLCLTMDLLEMREIPPLPILVVSTFKKMWAKNTFMEIGNIENDAKSVSRIEWCYAN